MTTGEKPAVKTGITHVLAAARYSSAGLKRLSRESAFRQEALAGFVVLTAGIIVLKKFGF